MGMEDLTPFPCYQGVPPLGYRLLTYADSEFYLGIILS